MITNYGNNFKRKLSGGERTMLMLPLNVVMVAKIRGPVDITKIGAVLDKLRNRHALLSARIIFDKSNVAWYVSKNVPEIPIKIIQRNESDQWVQTAKEEYKTTFPINTGPLLRFSLLHGSDKSELVICAHHAICDGISITYLIRDFLKLLNTPGQEIDLLPAPPSINNETVPSPPSYGFIAKMIMGLMNRIWSKKKIKFSSSDLDNLHSAYWSKNKDINILSWALSQSDTTALVSRCRDNNVTVNTALWTAFLAAQHDILGGTKPYRSTAGLAVSIRDRLNEPVGEGFGFYASSMTVNLKHDSKKKFWDMAKIMHRKIMNSLAKTNPFGMLVADLLHPTLIDSLYFSKYGLMSSRMSDKLLKKMMWDKMSYGYAITNVGNMTIPVRYGQLQLESIYGPFVYSDVNEKTVGIITIGGKMTFTVAYNKVNISSIAMQKLKEDAMARLTQAIDL